MLSQSSLRNNFLLLCRRLDAPKELSIYRTVAQGTGEPHVEIDTSRYHYVASERGIELERKTTSDADELLYWLISDVTFSMAFAYELEHRVENQDCRRLAFPKQIELLQRVNADWAEKKRVEQADILLQHPFTDRQGSGIV